MNKEEITERFAKAKELVSGIEEPYQSFALEVVFRWLLDQVGGIPKAVGAEASTAIKPSMALNEFLASRKPITHKDRVLLVAYYYFHSKNEPVTTSEIDEAYTLARMLRPKNLSDTVAKCVSKGYLVDYQAGKEGKRAWQITQTGEEYLQGEVATRPSRLQRR